MRGLMWLAAGAGVLTLAACDAQRSQEREHHATAVRREALRVIDRLDCPEKQGELKRVSVAADGRSCAYASRETEVVLRLIALNGGDAETALAPIETDLKTLVPAPKAAPISSGRHAKDGASIRLPGVRIEAGDHGADIKIGGLSINSRDDNAQVRIDHNVTVREGDKTVNIQANDEGGDGDVAIHADENGAEIRKRRLGPQSIRATLILASDKAPSGYHVVGYEARGPKGGPLAVAVVKAKDRNSDEHDVFKDMKALIRRNVGG
ncbi:MAG: hypothetical protein JWP92_2539 [Caulobacter sp.]|nr:hypothetical protein [Caulobacter sp.]